MAWACKAYLQHTWNDTLQITHNPLGPETVSAMSVAKTLCTAWQIQISQTIQREVPTTYFVWSQRGAWRKCLVNQSHGLSTLADYSHAAAWCTWLCCWLWHRHAADLGMVGQRDSSHDGGSATRCTAAALSHGHLSDHQCYVLHAALGDSRCCVHQVGPMSYPHMLHVFSIHWQYCTDGNVCHRTIFFGKKPCKTSVLTIVKTCTYRKVISWSISFIICKRRNCGIMGLSLTRRDYKEVALKR